LSSDPSLTLCILQLLPHPPRLLLQRSNLLLQLELVLLEGSESSSVDLPAKLSLLGFFGGGGGESGGIVNGSICVGELNFVVL